MDLGPSNFFSIMKPLIVLIAVFVSSTIISKLIMGDWKLIYSGNLAMFAMLILTSIGHFMFTKGMVLMMPNIIPFKKEMVYGTGIAEILLGLALLFPQTRYRAGIALIILFILMTPANIHAAVKHINLEKASFDGNGPRYLWFRIPLQILFIAWVWYFALSSHV